MDPSFSEASMSYELPRSPSSDPVFMHQRHGEWEIFAQHAIATLEKLGIPEQEKTEFLAAAESLRPDIVEVQRA